jgi:DNA polymerase-3 subunit beta
MNILCDGLDLSDAVLKVVKAVSAKAANPALECIKLKAKEDYLQLTATDQELSIEKKIRADVRQEGETLVAGKLFADFVKKLNREQIELKLTGGQLKISYMDSEGVLSCLNAAEYPKIPALGNCDSFVMKSCDLKDLVNKVIFSASADDTRPILKGCLLELRGQKITAVALDGYRLALCNKTASSATKDLTLIVPARTLFEISKFIEDGEEDVTVYAEKNHMMINVDSTTIISRLLEGEFINYRMIIPVDFTRNVTVDKNYFEDSLERASILSKGDKNNLVKFDVREKVMTITSNSDAGNIKENLAVVLKGQDIVIAFNAKYFSDALKNIEDPYVTLNFTSVVSPCILRPAEGEDYLYLILPVRIIS